MASITQTCANCQKQFLIIDQEQEFLGKKDLPLPINCPFCRQERRLKLRGDRRKLYKATCAKCGKQIITSYDPTTVESTILCKADYDQFWVENDVIVKEPLPEI